MKKIVAVLLLSNLFFASCGQTKTKPKYEPTKATTIKKEVPQSFVLNIDGKKFDIAETEILAADYFNKRLSISILSKEKDILFTLAAYVEVLKPGTFIVYSCDNGPTKCDSETREKGQSATLADYPTNTPSDPNTLKSAYNSPELGLTPLTFTITAVIDDHMRFQSKRIEGEFFGSLAHAEEKSLNNWQVVGKQVKVNGKFDFYFHIR